MRAAGSCVAAGAGGPYAVSSATATAAMSKLPNTTPHALFIFAILRTDDCYCNRPRPECCYEPVADRWSLVATNRCGYGEGVAIRRRRSGHRLLASTPPAWSRETR